MTKYNSIEALRFFFMLMICYWHYHRGEIFVHGYIAVEFFFILSGFLLFKSASKENVLSDIDYTRKKFLRFLPDNLIAICCAYFFYIALPAIGGGNSNFDDWIRIIPETLMLQNIGFYLGGLNTPMWYVSVLLWGGAILYALLRYNKQLFTKVLAPIIVITGYTYLFNINPDGSIESFTNNGILCPPMVRGISDMSLGILIASIASKDIIRYGCIWDLASFVSIILIIYISMSDECFDRYSLICYSVMVFTCFQPSSTLNKLFKANVWGHLGGITYQMLAYHYSLVLPLYYILHAHISLEQPVWNTIYLVSVVFIPYLIKQVYKSLNLWILKKRK